MFTSRLAAQRQQGHPVLCLFIAVLWLCSGYASSQTSDDAEPGTSQVDEILTTLSVLSDAIARQDMRAVRHMLDEHSTFHGEIRKNIEHLLDRYSDIQLEFEIIDVKVFGGGKRAVVVAKQYLEAVDPQSTSLHKTQSDAILEFVQTDDAVWKLSFWGDNAAIKHIGQGVERP